MVNGSQDAAELIVSRLVETDEVDDALGRFEPAWWYIVAVEKPGYRVSGPYYYRGLRQWSRDKRDAFSWMNPRDAEQALEDVKQKCGHLNWIQDFRLEPEYGKNAYDDIKFDRRNESVDPDDDIETAIAKVKPLAYVVACDSKEVPGHTYYLHDLSKFTTYIKDARMFASQDQAADAMHYAQKCNGYPTSSPRWMGRMYVTSYFGESLDDVADTLDRFQPDAWVLKAVAKLRNVPYWYSGLGRWSMEDPHDPDITLYRTAEDARKAKAQVEANYSVISWATEAGITVEPYYRQPFTEALMEAHYKNSTTQINIPENMAGHMMEWGKLNIPDEDLYIDEKGGCGREQEPHITVKYGVPMPTPSEQLRAIVHSFRPFSVQLGGVSLFENDLFDVVKLDVISEQLHELNRQISEAFPVESKFKDYVPHATIAYVKKGRGRALMTRDIFKDASDIPSAFVVQDIEFRGSGESDDPNRVVELLPLQVAKQLGESDEVTDLLDRTPDPDFVFQFDGDDMLGDKGPFYFAQTDRQGDEFYGTWERNINDATLYDAEDIRALIQSFSNSHPDYIDKFKSVMVIGESDEVADLIDRTQEPRYYIYYARGPLYYRGDPSSAPAWSSTKEEANTFPHAQAHEHLRFWRENYPQDADLFQVIPEYLVRENQEADDLLGRTIDDPGFMVIYTSVKHGVSYVYREEGTRAIRFSKHKPMATAFPYKEAQRIRDRIYDEQVQYWPGNTIEVVPAVHSVRENQDVVHAPDPLYTVSVHSVNDRCTYYFNANGNMSRSPTSLNRSQVRRARSAADKAFGKGQARVKPVNESKDDPFEGLGFAPDVQAFRRRGRKLRQTKRPIL